MDRGKRILGFFIAVIFSLIGTGILWGGSSTLQVSGFLVDADENPCSGSLNITFSIYTSSSEGTSEWTETDTVTCDNGIYTATLGDNESFGSLFSSNNDLFLGITVEGDSEMTPRLELSAVPFAQRAAIADAVGSGVVISASILDGTIATADVADSAVTSAKITDGTIAAGDMATGAVTTTVILDGTIATADVADSAVTSAKISDGTIAAGDMATGAVTTTVILDGTIATGDLADSAVTSAKISDGTIAGGDIADDTIDFDDIKDTLTLDTSTFITVSGSHTFGITNSGTGNSLLVNDETNDTTPFVVDASGNVGIQTTTPSDTLHVGTGNVRFDGDTTTIAANGTGDPVSQTLTPSTYVNYIDCQDTDGCTLTLSETGADDGQLLIIISVGTGSPTLSDSSGVSELAGNFAMGQNDSLSLVYVGDRWVETARSNN